MTQQITCETLRLGGLKDRLNELSQRVFDSMDTNLASVRLIDRAASQGRYLHFETEGRDDEMTELKEEAESLRNELSDLTKEYDALEAKHNQSESLLEEVKDDKGTLARYRDEAERSNGLCAQWRSHAKTCEDELSALRKRKGIHLGYFAKQQDILGLLRTLARCSPERHAEPQRQANEILQSILPQPTQ